MAELSRFIQFNNEQIDPRQMLHYEQLARALSNAPFLSMSERQLIEMRPQEQQIAMSVFWRHRDKETMHLGRLSDIYILTLGFWCHFDVNAYLEFEEEIRIHPLKNFLKQLVLLIEEFRLMDLVVQKRPGIAKSIQIRKKTYIESYKHRFEVNAQKGLLADACINYLYLAANEGMINLPENDVSNKFEPLLYPFQQIYDVKKTQQSIDLVYRIIPIIEEQISRDLVLDYYALMDSIPEAVKSHEHRGV